MAFRRRTSQQRLPSAEELPSSIMPTQHNRSFQISRSPERPSSAPTTPYREINTPNADAQSRGTASTTALPQVQDGSSIPTQQSFRTQYAPFATNSHRADGTSTRATSKNNGLSINAIAFLETFADVVFAVCLLACALVRINVVSLYYLLAFCFGTITSFGSKPLALVTFAVSLLALVGHITFLVLFKTHDSLPGADARSYFGFDRMDGAIDYWTSFGVDTIVIVCSLFHYFYVLRHLRAKRQYLDVFELGDHLMRGVRGTKRSSFQKTRAMRRSVGLLTATLLFITSLSVPAFVTAVYYLIFLQRLVHWTWKAKKETVAHLQARQTYKVTAQMFLGRQVTTFLMGMSAVMNVLWYIYHFGDIRQNDTMQKIALYAGFVDFSDGHADWTHYILLICQTLLMVCCAKLRILQDEVFKNDRVMHGAAAAPLQDAGATEQGSVRIEDLLNQQPFFTRVLLRGGGLLLASVWAICWCVSYPSYLSTPMMAWAFLYLALYGLPTPAFVIWVLPCYGVGLAIVEYICNLTIGLIDKDEYVSIGLKAFEYPFLDLGMHNLCLLFLFYSIRTRWRFEDLLKESQRQKRMEEMAPEPTRTSSGTISNEDKDIEHRPSTEDIQMQAEMQVQLESGWRSIVGLWLADAKIVVMTHVDALVLVTILAVVLSTRVSFIQIGYLAIAVVLMFFFERRRQFWRVLLCYALLACLAQFVRNIDCKENERLALIGLVCFDPNANTWGALWPTLFMAQLVIVFQLVFQMALYVANERTIEKGKRTIHDAVHNPIYFVSRLVVEIDNCFRIGGALLCYIAFLVVSMQYERGVTSLHTNFVGAIQLVLLFLILGNHLGGFLGAPRTSLRLKLLWSLALFIELLVLTCRYIYQFDRVANYLEEHFFTSHFVSAEAIGLENHSTYKNLSNVFFYLLPTAILMALTFWQMSSMSKDVKVYPLFAAGRSVAADRFLFALDSIRRILVAISTPALTIISMVVAIRKIDAIGALYVLTIILGRFFSGNWRCLWRPLFWIAATAAVLKFFIQMSTFDPEQETNVAPTHIQDTTDWIGLLRLSERYDTNQATASLWGLLSGELAIVGMCILHRAAQYFDGSTGITPNRSKDRVELAISRFEHDFAQRMGNRDLKHQTASNVAIMDSDDDVHPPSTAPSNMSHVTGVRGDSPRSPSSTAMLLNAGYSSGAGDKDFLSCLRDFCVDYASKVSVNAVILLFVVSSFLHEDIVSIPYMLIVYSLMYAKAVNVIKRWLLLAIVLSLVILIEYYLLLFLPPDLGWDKQSTFPWRIVPLDYQQWYMLAHQQKWAMLADFIALMAVYLLPMSHRFLKPSSGPTPLNQVSVMEASPLARHASGASGLTAQSPEVQPESQYIMRTRKYMWYYLEFIVLSTWLPVVLFTCFVVGANQGGILSLAYVWASGVMLYRIDDTRDPQNVWIRYLRRFNWFHLFLIIVLQAPYFRDQLLDCKLGNRSAADAYGGCASIANLLGVPLDYTPVGLIVVFAFISVQCEMLQSSSYFEVCQYYERELLRAHVRSYEITRAFFKERTAQWLQMKREKSAAIQRLRVIVSKLVHKVHELMDIAMGLHHNLPPMAPPRPTVVDTTQNSVTLSWEPPSESLHKIRFYRIVRQQYPSLTLLGDFGDLMEVKGSTTQVTIEGLRPGTSYQFKVAAVSRMGEGPFSTACDPVSTLALNLNGTCTAGWMKYRREHVPPPKLDFVVSWMRPKYLHRYVVVDNNGLAFYQDEEKALKHRSRKRRKKIKTSFPWRHVLKLQLSENKVQFDDVSPLLYTYQIVVRSTERKCDFKYEFQVEQVQDFAKFLQALAFAAPKDALQPSILSTLAEKNLPSPLDQEARDIYGKDDDTDDSHSEWSSVTGDESTLGDLEDLEFDKEASKSLLSWRIPVYRFVYELQDAGFRLDTIRYEPEDQFEPSMAELLRITTNVFRSHSAAVCCLVMVISFMSQADLLNMIYVLFAFCYLILENPRPSAKAWVTLLLYSFLVIGLRYAYQLSVFCDKLNNDGYYVPSVEPHCTSMNSYTITRSPQAIQPMVLLGLYKFDESAISSISSIYIGLQWDFYIVLAILWHRRELMIRGFWISKEEEGDEDMVLHSDVIKNSESSSRDSIDEVYRVSSMRPADNMTQLPPQPTARQSSEHESSEMENGSSTDARLGDVHMLTRQTTTTAISNHMSKPSTDMSTDLASELLGELQEEEEEEERLKAAEEEDKEEEGAEHQAPQRLSSDSIPEDEKKEKEQVEETEQVEIEDSTTNVNGHTKQKWLEQKIPKVYHYFQGVMADPPPQWDKDIYVAVQGEKPGRDFYTSSLAVQLFLIVYSLIFFEDFGEPSDESDVANASGRLTSSSMLSGYLVLTVFIQMITVIWDRVAFVRGSLRAKLVLQYVYTFVLHLTVWYLIPSHTNKYFQHRAGLVIFYLVQCCYLWLGALQIRYGYQVFRGSRYNYTKHNIYTKLSEVTFPLMMLIPFLFEMRALLDYICTKTSLEWAHWVLLEDAGAHLFKVKLEMRKRVQEAEVLQGKRRQPMRTKLMTAGVMLFFLLLCLIGPLAIFSSANPSTAENKVTHSTVVFGLEDSFGTFSELYSNADFNSPDFDIDKNTEGASVQRIRFNPFSRYIWTTSPPRIDLLVSQIQANTTKLQWSMKLTFVRPGPENDETVEQKYYGQLDPEQRELLVRMLDMTNKNGSSIESTEPLLVPDLYPPIMQLTATEGVLNRSTTMRSIKLQRHMADSQSWWTIDSFNEATSSKEDYCSKQMPFCIIAVSDNIVQGLNSLDIDQYGLAAVYFFVVVTIGSAVKGFFRGKIFEIQYAELPDPEDVLELIEGVYIARDGNYIGHLKDEVRIFETLIRVLRSPETLTKVTGANVIHIPKAKIKLE